MKCRFVVVYHEDGEFHTLAQIYVPSEETFRRIKGMKVDGQMFMRVHKGSGGKR